MCVCHLLAVLKDEASPFGTRLTLSPQAYQLSQHIAAAGAGDPASSMIWTAQEAPALDCAGGTCPELHRRHLPWMAQEAPALNCTGGTCPGWHRRYLP